MTTRKTFAALGATGALLLAGCGGDGAHSGGHSDSGSGNAASGAGVDRAFVAAMIPHHESAVEMAEIARERATSPFVQKLADDIVRTQTEEIATLRKEDAQLAADGVGKGSLGVDEHHLGMDDDPAILENAEPFDTTFMEMMVPHHEGAVEMAKAEIAKGEDPELKALAKAIITAQQREIRQMNERLGETGHGSGHSS